MAIYNGGLSIKNVSITESGGGNAVTKIEANGNTITATKGTTFLTSHQSISGKLDKVTYEYNKEIAFGSTGYLCIGKFPCYDSNITVYIDSTTSTTYHGVLIVATQNINTSGGGSLNAHTYGDVSNTLTSALKLEYNSGSNSINIYFQPEPWSKNLIHIRCNALAGAPTDVVTSINSIPSTANRTITNLLKSSLDGKAASSHGTHVSGTAFTSGNSGTSYNCNDFTGNGIAYYTTNGPATSLGASTNDGALYSQAYNTSWVAQIAQDYRNGNLFVRGKKEGTWQAWKKVWVSGDAVTGAVWNDLIDCIEVSEGDSLEPGYCYGMCEDGHYRKTDKYLDNKFIGIDSDTYSLAMGMEPEKRKLNAAVSGFVLAYVDKEYPIGTALTCTKDGFLTEMKKEDKCYNPELIIATYWKNEEKEEIVREDKTVKVNGRKWVKIK